MARVTFDSRAIRINGRRELILSGAVHYPRSTPALWPRILAESKRAGLNTIETYVFWEQHEPQEGVYDFSGRRDLGHFLDLCGKAGFHVILRIGPYVCAETNFGGLPWWLTTKPGLVTRTLNAPFMAAVEGWMRRLLAEIGDRQATRGGPIILAQLENEYGNVAKRYGDDGARYLEWCLACGRSAGLEVPLILCEGAPRGAISTLNGFSVWSRVAALRRERPSQPVLWTEAWTGWYDTWGEPHHLRKVQDIAFEVLRFFGAGGTGINHYMWHGGTNFDRDAMFLQVASYDFDAPLDEYGSPTPKSDALGVLHAALRRHAECFLHGRRRPPEVLIPGHLPQHADGVVGYPFRFDARECLVVVNGNDWPKRVSVRGVDLELPDRSGVLMVGSPERMDVVYRSWDVPPRPARRPLARVGGRLRWRGVPEPLPRASVGAWTPVGLPHSMLPETRDTTDYGWYAATLDLPAARRAVLRLGVADLACVWLNGRRVSSPPTPPKEERLTAREFELETTLALRKGRNRLLVLVSAIGMIKGDWNIGAPMSEERKGMVAVPSLDGRPLEADWTFQPGLAGERDDPFRLPVDRRSGADSGLRWWRCTFRLTARDLADGRSWGFDTAGLGKGFVWINGQGLGRYWTHPSADALHARYTRHPHLINTGYGQPTQRVLHIPPDWLRVGANSLLVLEELSGMPEAEALVATNALCDHGPTRGRRRPA